MPSGGGVIAAEPTATVTRGAASIFAEFGADILKIEHPVAGDPFRRFASPTGQPDRSLAEVRTVLDEDRATWDPYRTVRQALREDPDPELLKDARG